MAAAAAATAAAAAAAAEAVLVVVDAAVVVAVVAVVVFVVTSPVFGRRIVFRKRMLLMDPLCRNTGLRTHAIRRGEKRGKKLLEKNTRH